MHRRCWCWWRDGGESDLLHLTRNLKKVFHRLAPTREDEKAFADRVFAGSAGTVTKESSASRIAATVAKKGGGRLRGHVLFACKHLRPCIRIHQRQHPQRSRDRAQARSQQPLTPLRTSVPRGRDAATSGSSYRQAAINVGSGRCCAVSEASVSVCCERNVSPSPSCLAVAVWSAGPCPRVACRC